MTRSSIAESWDDAARFLRREYGLLLPLAFATIGTASVLYALSVPETAANEIPTAGPWLLVLIPVLLLVLLGNIAVALLVLKPGNSVGEALAVAARRLPLVLLVVALFTAAFSLAVLVLSVGGAALAAASGSNPVQAASAVVVLLVPLLIFVGVRLLPLWPVIADAAPGLSAVAAVRRAFALTQGAFWRLLWMLLLYLVTVVIVDSAVRFGAGSVLLLIGRVTGAEPAMRLVITIVLAAVDSGLQAAWGVFVAMLYRRLGSASSGI